ncbi:MAG: hypothetical protein ACPGWR_31760 [Ardenticatenaceae bacterium]
MALRDPSGFCITFVTYLADTQSPEDVKKLIERTKQLSAEVGGEMLTALQAWTLQGRRKGEKIGRLEKEIEIVEKFLKVGMGWDGR